VQHIPDLQCKFAQMPHHVWNKDKRQKLQDENTMACPITQGVIITDIVGQNVKMSAATAPT